MERGDFNLTSNQTKEISEKAKNASRKYFHTDKQNIRYFIQSIFEDGYKWAMIENKQMTDTLHTTPVSPN